MSAQRIQAALLVSGLIAADLAAIQFTRTARVEFVGLILVGLAAATVGGLGLLTVIRSNRALPEDKADAAPASARSFGLRSLMLVTAMFAVWVTAIAATHDYNPHNPVYSGYSFYGNHYYYYNDPWYRTALIAIHAPMALAPVWVPLTVFAYIAGRRSVSWGTTIAFVLLECAALAGYFWAAHYS